MEIGNLITSTEVGAIVSFIVGGGLMAFLKSIYDYQTTAKKDKLAFDQQELQKYKERTSSLEQRLLSLESSLIQSSIPEWRKDCSGRYEYINMAYEMDILLPLREAKEEEIEIIGKTDEEIFDDWPDFVKLLKSLDQEAVTSVRKFAIRRNVQFPNREEEVMLIKEIAQTFEFRIVLIGRSFPETKL